MNTVKRIAKFGAVGGIAFIVDVAVFNLLCHVGSNPLLQDDPFLAKAISTLIAIFLTWLGNRLWTFRGRGRTERAREFAVYFVLSLVGLGISLLCLWVSRSILGLDSPWADNVAANVIGLVAGSAFKFWSYQSFVFTAREGRRRVDEDVSAQPAVQRDPRPDAPPSTLGATAHIRPTRRPAVVSEAAPDATS